MKEFFSRTWRSDQGLDLLLLLAITLIFGLPGGTPYFHPDEVLDEAMASLARHGNPRYFHYPGLVIYAHAALYGLLFLLARGAGLVRTLPEFAERSWAVPFELPGHLLTVLFSFLGVAAAYQTTRRLTGKRALSLLAGGLAATSLIWVRNSHYLTVDIPLAALGMATGLISLRLFRNPGGPNTGQFALLGVMIGLTAAAKYNGALIAAAVVLPALLAGREQLGKTFARLALCGVIAALVFAAANPFMFEDFPLFQEHFRSRMEELQEGRPGFFMSNGWLFHLTNSLGQEYGPVPLLLALAGGVWLVRARHLNSAEKAALGIFPLLFYILMGRSRAAFVRHILPVIPFLGVFSALGAGWLWDRVDRASSRRFSRALARVMVLALLVPGVLLSWRHNVLLARGDIRRDLETVLSTMAVPWSELSVYSGRYLARTVHRSGIAPRLYRFSSYSFRSPGDPLRYVHRINPDVILMDSFSHDRLLRGTDEPPSGASGLTVVRITPFTRPKARVPLSHESIYSPAPPDLRFRRRAGPYIELYFHDPVLAEAAARACREAGLASDLAPGEEGFYYARGLATYLKGQ